MKQGGVGTTSAISDVLEILVILAVFEASVLLSIGWSHRS